MPDRNLENQGPLAARKKKLDLLFVQDTTGSQEKYIQAATARCVDVCLALQTSGELEQQQGLRLGLIAYRDHKDEYVTDDFGGFTYDVNTVVGNLKKLVAKGGGDGPEAVTSALDKAFKMKWRSDAAKVVVLIADAPPHGIGERDDDYWDGDPDGKDPLFVSRSMSKRGITLLFIACEATLSNSYDMAHDFFMAITRITAGSMMPLTNTNILAPIIVGFVLEHIGLESLISEFQGLVESYHKQGMNEEEIKKKLFEVLKARETKVTTLQSTKVYNDGPDTEKNIAVWVKSPDTPTARDELLGVLAKPHVPPEFVPTKLPWPKTLIEITFRNTSDDYIQYSYPEDGQNKTGTLGPNQIQEQKTKMWLNEAYMFSFRIGTRVRTTMRVFTREQDFDLAVFFD